MAEQQQETPESPHRMRRCIHLIHDLLFIGEQGRVNKLFKSIQHRLLLRPTAELTVGNTISFLGRNICNKGGCYKISLADSYTTELLKEENMLNCNAALPQ